MSNLRNSTFFFKNGTSRQFKFCLDLYPQALKIKETQKCKEGDLIRLDKWYQNDLPEAIQKRGRNAHIVHKELVQAMKWKQTRGKFFPQLTYLIKLNTDRVVLNESKKAFKKLPNLEQAVIALSTLKGVGVSMASAILSAACPQEVPFMADECLLSIPEIGAIDYTTNQYLQFVQHIQETVRRLNTAVNDSDEKWNAHTVELALWAHYVISKSYPSLLEDMPNNDISSETSLNDSTTSSKSVSTDSYFSMNGNLEGENPDETLILQSKICKDDIIPSINKGQLSDQKILRIDIGNNSSTVQIPNIPKKNGEKRQSSFGLSTNIFDKKLKSTSEVE